MKQINESFKKKYANLSEASEVEETLTPQQELRKALEDKLDELESKGTLNIKDYEIGFQDVIENLYPDKEWWEVTDCNIFMSLFNSRQPEETIMDIIANMKVDEDTQVEESVNSVEYVKWIQLPNKKWKMWGGSNDSELDPEFLDRVRKQNGIEYLDAKIAKAGEYPDGVSEDDVEEIHRFTEDVDIDGLPKSAKNIANEFKNYSAFEANFAPIIIVKQGKNYFVYKTNAQDYNDYLYNSNSKDNIDGWLYGAVQCANGWFDRKPSSESLTEGWRGTNVELVSHGNWADPDLVWGGYTFNYWDIEDALWSMFLEETGHNDSESNDPDVEAEFDKYVQDNYEGYLSDVIAGGYFDKGSTNWHDRYKKESLMEGVSTQTVEDILSAQSAAADVVENGSFIEGTLTGYWCPECNQKSMHQTLMVVDQGKQVGAPIYHCDGCDKDFFKSLVDDEIKELPMHVKRKRFDEARKSKKSIKEDKKWVSTVSTDDLSNFSIDIMRYGRHMTFDNYKDFCDELSHYFSPAESDIYNRMKTFNKLSADKYGRIQNKYQDMTTTAYTTYVNESLKEDKKREYNNKYKKGSLEENHKVVGTYVPAMASMQDRIDEIKEVLEGERRTDMSKKFAIQRLEKVWEMLKENSNELEEFDEYWTKRYKFLNKMLTSEISQTDTLLRKYRDGKTPQKFHLNI